MKGRKAECNSNRKHVRGVPWTEAFYNMILPDTKRCVKVERARAGLKMRGSSFSETGASENHRDTYAPNADNGRTKWLVIAW